MKRVEKIGIVFEAIQDANDPDHPDAKEYIHRNRPHRIAMELQEVHGLFAGEFTECVDALLRVGLIYAEKDDNGRVFALKVNK